MKIKSRAITNLAGGNRIIPASLWHTVYPWPRKRGFHNYTGPASRPGGLDDAIHKVHGRVVVNEDLFFAWVADNLAPVGPKGSHRERRSALDMYQHRLEWRTSSDYEDEHTDPTSHVLFQGRLHKAKPPVVVAEEALPGPADIAKAALTTRKSVLVNDKEAVKKAYFDIVWEDVCQLMHDDACEAQEDLIIAVQTECVTLDELEKMLAAVRRVVSSYKGAVLHKENNDAIFDR